MSNVLEVVVKSIDDKLAKDIVVLDMEGISPILDHYVICHGTSDRQIKAIAQSAKKDAEVSGINVEKVEGLDSKGWVLVDFGDVVLHVFSEEERFNYHLEKLWGEVPRIDISKYIEQ